MVRIKNRVLKAIEAEEETDCAEHFKILENSKDTLEKQGKLLADLKLEVDPRGVGDIFTVTFANGNRLPSNHQFKTRQTVILLKPIKDDEDIEESLSCNGETPAADHPGYSSEEAPRSRNPSRGMPSTSAENQTNSSRHNPDLETLASRLATLGFTKGFNARIVKIQGDSIVIEARQPEIYEMVEDAKVNPRWARSTRLALCFGQLIISFARPHFC